MTPRIAVFFHCLFQIGDKPLPLACQIVTEQMQMLRNSGLAQRADEIIVGINGTPVESGQMLEPCGIPKKARVVYHGLESRSENLTIVELERWLPGHEGWYVLYFHAKNSTHGIGSRWEGDDKDEAYEIQAVKWRNCMMRHCVHKWQRCVDLLTEGYEAVGAHWLTGMTKKRNQHLFGGNFWWSRADFLLTLPSITERACVKECGIGSLGARYESEIILGNGPRLPRIKDLADDHKMWQCPQLT